MTYDVFISYSRKDSEVANKIYKTLIDNGISCFMDLEGISGGADFPTVLAEAIMSARLMLYLASEHSYASEFTQKELTFAVNNKGSRFIFPLIIDNSELPKNLEFLLSNINWRILSSRYTVENDLPADIKKRLEDPHAGETIKQQEKKSIKKMATIIFSVIALAAAIVLGLFVRQSLEQKRQAEAERQAEEAAFAAVRECETSQKEAGKAISKADSLRNLKNSFATFELECTSLEDASRQLAKVDSICNAYHLGAYASLFSGVSTAGQKQQITARRDSMFRFWSQTARLNYNDYLLLPDEGSKEIALRYVNWALRLRPSDAGLLEIKDKLNK